MTPKQQVLRIIDMLPDDFTIAELQYHLMVLEKVRVGIEQCERGERVTHEEVVKRLSRWLGDRKVH